MSKKYSLQGWDFVAWLKGNKRTIIELVKVGVPYGLTQLAQLKPEWVVAGTIAGKLLLDVVHYWAKEQ